MRNPSTPISGRTSPDRRPPNGRRREAEKSTSERKPLPKRSLNEAAHKLGR
jgi:hypothetical protein